LVLTYFGGFKNHQFVSEFAFMLHMTVFGPVGLKSQQEGPKPEQVTESP